MKCCAVPFILFVVINISSLGNSVEVTNYVQIFDNVYLSITDDFANPDKDFFQSCHDDSLVSGRRCHYLVINKSTNRHGINILRGKPFSCRLLGPKGLPLEMTSYGKNSDPATKKRLTSPYKKDLEPFIPGPHLQEYRVLFDIERAFRITAPGTYTFEATLVDWKYTNGSYLPYPRAFIKLPFVVVSVPKGGGDLSFLSRPEVRAIIAIITVVLFTILLIRFNRQR
jgi:hypothetical protein